MQSLALARAGGIRVVPEQARKYAQLIPLVQAHARGQFIYAAPNCPEVYFLSGLHNPTQTLYDFLDLDFPNSRVRTQRILHTIRSHNVTEIVLKDNSEFQGTIPAALRAIFDSEFPQEARVADFEVRWRP